MNGSEIIENEQTMSFFTFISENYEESRFFLPKMKPFDDSLDKAEMEKINSLIYERDHYEINSIIRNRYTVK